MTDDQESPLNFLGMYSSIGGRVLSRYEIGPPIGHGAMGHVYKARDARLNRPVAIKVLPHWARGDPQSRERLRSEARAASALNHPNIVTIYDIDQESGVDLMVMEYLAGKTLNELIPARGLPVPKAVDIALQITDALTAAHSASILHRDLKPSNVMVTDEGRVKVLDFGLATVFTPDGPEKYIEISDQPGTRVYMSPEQLQGHAADPRSEIFSLGLVLHQMLSGKHPFGPGSRAELADAIQTKPPANLPSKVPLALAKLVYRCLEKTSEQRFESMQHLLTALREFSVPAQGLLRVAADKLPTPSVVPADVLQVRAITKRIGYKNVPQSRNALEELRRLIQDPSFSTRARAATIADLKTQILTLDDYGWNGVPGSVRDVRILVLDTMKIAVEGELGRYFNDRDLERLDLYDMNFGGEQLTGLSFRRCFLIESSFRESNLNGASFSRACIRNVDFAKAKLSDVEFTDADWFNALNLKTDQLARARRDTLMHCPPSVEGMHNILEARYGLRFDSWTERVQEELLTTWKEYLRPGGLREVVADWRRTPQTLN